MSCTTTQAFNHKSPPETLPPLQNFSHQIWDSGSCQFASWRRTATHTSSHLALLCIYLVKTHWLLPALIKDLRNLCMFLKLIFWKKKKTLLLTRGEVMWTLKNCYQLWLSLITVSRNIVFISLQNNFITHSVMSQSVALTDKDLRCQRGVREVLMTARKNKSWGQITWE